MQLKVRVTNKIIKFKIIEKALLIVTRTYHPISAQFLKYYKKTVTVVGLPPKSYHIFCNQ